MDLRCRHWQKHLNLVKKFLWNFTKFDEFLLKSVISWTIIFVLANWASFAEIILLSTQIFRTRTPVPNLSYVLNNYQRERPI